MATVLVVDDDAMACQLACIVLRHAGHDVHEARNGDEALHMIAMHSPEILLLDMHMPGTDGFEVLRRLDESGRRTNIRVLAVTGMAMPGDEQRIRGAGCDVYMSKPYAYKQLLEAVALLASTDRGKGGCQ